MKFNQYKSVHFVGIGGIGISAVARLFLQLKKKVSGSDAVDSAIISDLRRKGALIKIGHHASNLPDHTELVIFSAAVPTDNPEIEKANDLKIKCLSYPQSLGLLMKNKKGIAVSGTNGKTTVTAMAGEIMAQAGLDPTVIVGSQVKAFDGNLRLGQSEYLVAEACEYRGHMLNLNPQIIVLTNIEEDHLDFYRDLEDITNHFQKFIDKLKPGNVLILNNDDEQISRLKKPPCTIITYGLNHPSDLIADNIIIEDKQQRFDLIFRGKKLGQFILRLPSLFNVYNCLAALALALYLGIPVDILKGFTLNFLGLWRRTEKIGEIKGIPVFSDYAHHPQAIRGIIAGFKQFYPGKRILVVFQPHQHARTKTLFQQFVNSFDQADLAIINEIYSVPGREDKKYQDISSRDLVREIKKRGKTVLYTKNLDDTRKTLIANLEKNDLVLILGAGDIYKVGEGLVR